MGRKAVGIELKKEYFNQSVQNMKALEMEDNQLTIEDMFINLDV
jgi:hypothetical protein